MSRHSHRQTGKRSGHKHSGAVIVTLAMLVTHAVRVLLVQAVPCRVVLYNMCMVAVVALQLP